MAEGENFDSFIKNDVPSRLYDKEGSREYDYHLKGLALTNFGRENLYKILEAKIQEEPDWAIGESIAEAYLKSQHNIVWPWNTERDKKTPWASLPGADLVGFRIERDDVHLVLGEVKTSHEAKTPPGVMKGKSGMIHQINKLASNLDLMNQLLKWLLPRCRGTEYEEYFKSAVTSLLNTGNKDIALFGVLIRDTEPNQEDLVGGAHELALSLKDPSTCKLIAIYIPCPIIDLQYRIAGGES